MDKNEHKDFMNIFNNASKLHVQGLKEGYKKLLEFNDIILAVKKFENRMPEDTFEFVTWQCSADNSVCWGHYTTDYTSAKEDFTKRCGLIPKGKMFDESELLLIHSGLVKVGAFPDFDHATRKGIGQIIEKIEGLELEALKEFLYKDEITDEDNSLELEP